MLPEIQVPRKSHDLHTRKDKKVSNVMGCELKRQLSEPGAGAACESIAT